MKKTYLQVISPVLHPRMHDENGEQPAGIKHANLETIAMIGMGVSMAIVLTLVYLFWS